MSKLTKRVLAVFLSALLAVCSIAMPVSAFEMPEKTTEKAEYIEGEVIAVLKDTAPKSFLNSGKAVASYGKGVKMNDSFTYNKKNGKIRAVVLKSNTKSTKTMLKELKKNDQVKYAFPNYKVKVNSITNDTYSEYQWALDNNGASGGTVGLDTNADSLWDAAASSEEEQVVAVVDTGIDFEHEDIKDILWNNPYGSKLVGKHGYDFSDTIKDHSPLDDNGHGTHVAGIIAGVADNEKGISGINKSNTRIMACKFLDEAGSGSTEGALAAYEYIMRAVDLGTNIVAVNNSWGGPGDEAELMLFDEIFDALGEKGVITLAAAGNEASDLSDTGDEDDFFFDGPTYVVPANSSSKYCITVAASNEKDELADFSNYSPEYVDVAAPGTDILSSVSYNCFNPTLYDNAKRNAICSDFQDYEGTVSESSFGYPKSISIAIEDGQFYEVRGIESQTEISDKGFALSSKSVQTTFMDDVEEDESRIYGLEIPYSVEDENKAYSLSFMYKANKGLLGFVCDVPADFDVAKDFEDLPIDFDSVVYGGEIGNYWDHYHCDVNPSDKYYDKKLKGKDRKIVFIIETYEKDTQFNIDDIAISAQDVNADDFGKYDFYNGTSMATPYVTGAVALVHNAFPDAEAAEVINIIKNTGRVVPELKDKVETSRVLSLDNTDKAPAMLISAVYDENGKVEVSGAFTEDTTFKINSKAVTPIDDFGNTVLFDDDSYNTKKVTIEAENAYGSDSLSVLLSNKPSPELNPIVSGMPMMNYSGGYYMPQGAISIPAGDKSYFVSEMGEIGSIYYDELEETYLYDDMLPQINLISLFDKPNNVIVKNAAYLGGKIYFTAINEINSDYTGITLGYDSVFGAINLETGETETFCEAPDGSDIGSALAVFKGNIYVIGGYDRAEHTFSNDVYKFSTGNSKFTKTSYSLPEGRAFTRFIQFGETLVGVYGANESGALPKIIKFNGSKWTYSSFDAQSDDFETYSFDDKDVNVYYGNVGYSAKGLYLNGAYIYGLGDTYIYTLSTDKLVASKYSFSNSIGENKLFATTLPGCFIAYPCGDGGEEVFGSYIGDDDDEKLGVAYCYNINNSYAKVDDSKLTHAYTSVPIDASYAYGDKVTIKVTPEKGYIINSVSIDGIKLNAGTTEKTVVLNKAKTTVMATTKKVAPNKVTGVKVKLDSKKKKYTVSWKKPSRAQGYQVQSYVNGSWKTLKTVKSGETLKCTVTKSKAGKKFRVRAYSKYNSKTYYGLWSSTYTVK